MTWHVYVHTYIVHRFIVLCLCWAIRHCCSDAKEQTRGVCWAEQKFHSILNGDKYPVLLHIFRSMFWIYSLQIDWLFVVHKPYLNQQTKNVNLHATPSHAYPNDPGRLPGTPLHRSRRLSPASSKLDCPSPAPGGLLLRRSRKPSLLQGAHQSHGPAFTSSNGAFRKSIHHSPIPSIIMNYG